MEGANSKVGAYPMADQPNQFGTFYANFFQAWKTLKTKEACWPDFMGALGIAKANQDQAFEDALGQVNLEVISLTQMVGVMWEAWALSVRLSWWTWQEEEREELVMR